MCVLAKTTCLRLVLALSALLAIAGAARADLVSHRALYKLTLGSSGSASTVADLNGRMALELVDVCDGWTLGQRIVLDVVRPDGQEFRSYTSFTSWESKDGTRFRFAQQTKHNGQTIEEMSGRAVVDPVKGGVAYLTKPEEIEIPLPGGTLFPTRHTALLIARAQAGERHFLGVVFDGTTLDNPNKVSVFIGAPAQLPGLVEGAGPLTAWPVRVAFFALERKSPEPDIEIGMMLQADGVARDVDLDYQAFTVHGELETFEPLPPLSC